MNKLPKELTLDYKKWICGYPHKITKDKEKSHGKGYTSLLNEEGYMCCLGQFSLQAGASKEDIICHSFPEKKLGLNFPPKFVDKAIDINDDDKTTVAEKVKRLQSLCKKYKRTLTLKNFPKSIIKDGV